ncbi:MAG TPA: hypothetical protein ENI23_00510 [bacterium]|nr:hypothetical protein [bacterium]
MRKLLILLIVLCLIGCDKPPITWRKFHGNYIVEIKFTDFEYYDAKWQDKPIIIMNVQEPKSIMLYLKGKKGAK